MGVIELSKQLATDFGKGFSYANLWNFRQFYLTWHQEEKFYTLRRELTWSHYRLIMRVDNRIARDFYIHESVDQKWSTRVLERNINSLLNERMLSNQNANSPIQATTATNTTQPRDFIKDPYVLEFLDLPENPWPQERSIESAILDHLQSFLLEMGPGFSFVGRQYRISTETKHFYVDLVFGLILCTQKDETVVRYSSLKESEQIFASRYRLVLPTEEKLASELERE
jgi:predicted nuclease of restriction endonuclease-like (RecB) superfamily